MANEKVFVKSDVRDLLAASDTSVKAILANSTTTIIFADAKISDEKGNQPMKELVMQPNKFGARIKTIEQKVSDFTLAKPLLAFTVGNEDIFAAADKAQALELANTLTKPVPAYVLGDVEQVQDQFLNRPWGKSKYTLQQRLEARSEPGYLAGWQD